MNAVVALSGNVLGDFATLAVSHYRRLPTQEMPEPAAPVSLARTGRRAPPQPGVASTLKLPRVPGDA